MVKYKAKIKDCQLIVRAKISSGEEISNRELDFFSHKPFRGFLKPTLIRKNLIEYRGPMGVSLYERLKKPINQFDFYFIMEQVVAATELLQANGMFSNKLVLDLRYVFINETTKEIQFIYMPLVGNCLCVDVIGFMESIIYSIHPMEGENSDYISKYICFVRGLGSYNPRAIEKYIAKENKKIVSIVRKHHATQSGFITNKQKEYYEHLERKDEEIPHSGPLGADEFEETGLMEDEDYMDETGLMGNEDYMDETGLMEDEDYMNETGLMGDEEEDETTYLDEDKEEGTALLDEEQVHFPILIRVKSNETVIVDKPVFRIGKERSYVDYFVTNNNAVSRSHADIITRGNRYYIFDQNSRNHTYVNQAIVPVRNEVEIFDGDRLKLANEEFIFRT